VSPIAGFIFLGFNISSLVYSIEKGGNPVVRAIGVPD